MADPLEEKAFPGRFRAGSWLFLNLFFSSFLLLFLFWSLTTLTLLDGLRTQSSSSAHLLVVFLNVPSEQEVAGLKATLEKIAGTGSVLPMSAGPLKTPSASFRRVLDVTLTLGRSAGGRVVPLADQVQSIQTLLKNDAQIRRIIFSENWIARVDALARISDRIRTSFVFFLMILSLGLAVYWGALSHTFGQAAEVTFRPGERSPEEREPVFRRDPLPSERVPVEGVARTILPFPGMRHGGLFGCLCGLLALFLAWSSRQVLYPPGMDPFHGGLPGALSPALSAVILPAFSGGLGMLGGLVRDLGFRGPEPEAGKGPG